MPHSVLYLEPFDTGSHAQFTRTLTRGIDAEWTVLTLPGRHWKWRMRGSAVHFALQHAEALSRPHDLLVASSFLPLAELRGLVPALAAVPALLYFHENQLTYPTRPHADAARDLHFGFTQLTSALAAQRCVFNSRHNLESFLQAGRELLARMPDAAPTSWIDRIAERSIVLGVPLEMSAVAADALGDVPPGPQRGAGPTLLWNHRWEHDKNPEAFFAALEALAARDVPFRVAVCGERFREAPAIFGEARQRLGSRVAHWGYAASRSDYEALLQRSQIAVSTASHEFFGTAMLEATHHGAYPLVPDRLAYPELFPADHRYADAQLADELERRARQWIAGDLDLRADRSHLTTPHLAAARLADFARLFEMMVSDTFFPWEEGV